MNKVLAATIRFLNGFLALFIIAACAFAGRQYGAVMGLHSNGLDSTLGLVAGLFVGFVAAVVVCGFLALFIEMRSELIRIRELLARNAK